MTNTARIAALQLRAFDIEDAAASLTHTLAQIDAAAATERPDIIALPEVTYPGYFMQRDDLAAYGIPSTADAADAIAAAARRHRIYVAAGMALDAPGGGYTNAAVLFGRDGSVVGTYAKSFLWHFDKRWFVRGDAYPVFETDLARVGMLVCADGRLPEIARALALNGAQIVLDLTAWVSGARRPEGLETIQREYLMPVRAAENGVWVVAADKCGVEAESIVYAGRSCVIRPDGAYAAELGPQEEGALVFDVPVVDAAPPIGRRPELYAALAEPTEALPVLASLGEPLVIADEDRRIAVAQLTLPPDAARFLSTARRWAERQALQDADVLVLPATPAALREGYDADLVHGSMMEIAKRTGVMLAYTTWEANGGRSMHLVGRDGQRASHAQTHSAPDEGIDAGALGAAVSPVVEAAVGRVGLMVGAEGFVPEVARSLMLRGAEVILWCADTSTMATGLFVRARAEENRLWVACAGAPTATGATMIVDPSGRVAAVALEGRELCVGVEVNRTLAHQKSRAPGTDVVRDRQPATYGALVQTRVATQR